MTEPMTEDVQKSTSFYKGLKSDSIEQVKGLAPWRPGLPWWVLLVEGIILALIGLLILIDPRQTTVNVALFLSAVMAVAGILQLLAVFRGKAPESVDALIAARGSIAAFTGAMILLLYFLEYITQESAKTALLLFSMGALIFGITGFVVSVRTKGSRRRGGIIDGLFFTAFAALLLYVVIVGPRAGDTVQLAIEIVAWIGIVGGLGIIALSFFNRSKEKAGGADVAAAEVAAEEPAAASRSLGASDEPASLTTPEPASAEKDEPDKPSIGGSSL